MAVNIQKFLPPAKSYGNIEKYSRANNEISPVINENLSAITIKVIDVDKILKGTLASDKKELDDKKKEDNLKKRQKAEEALEAKPDKKGGDKLSLPKLPKMGFLDWIKNFISNMILGFFAVRMIEHLPKLKGILSLIGNATDLAIDLGGKFLNGLVTFIDWGYKAYDATRGFLKDLGGENFTKVFDGFVNVIDDVIEAAIIASIAISSFRDEKEPDLGPGGKPGGGKTPLKTGKELYAEYDPKRSLIRKNYGDAAARIYDNEIANGKTPKQALLNLRERYIKKGRILPQRALRLGEIQGSKVLGRGLAKAPQRAATKALVGAFGKGGAKTVLKFIRPFLKRIPIPVVGALIDFGLSVALDEKPGRAAFKAIGSGLAGIIGTAIGSIPPLAIIGGPLIGAALGGWAGDALGGALYDAFFENKKPKQQAKPKVQGRSEGGTIEELFAPKFTKGGLNSFNISKESFDVQSSPNIITSGLVKGQKGVDKIPTMIPEGTFVMSRGAVRKYGISALDSMNSSTPSFGGGIVKQTKGSVLNTSNSPSNLNLLGSTGASSGSMLRPVEVLMNYLIGHKGGESVVKGVDKIPKMFAEGGLNSFNIPKESSNTQSSSDVFSAGLVKGQKGVDKIPTMLPEGAFVMSRGAVQKHGVNTLESMNASAPSFGSKVVNQTKSIFNTAHSYISQRETNVLGPLGMIMSYLIGPKGGESVIKGIDKFPQMFAEGGVTTRGGKLQGPVQRTLEKGKYKREIAKKPGEVRIDSPGSEVGGKEKILKLFPDPFESMKGKADQKPQEYTNPFNVVKSTGENLGKSDYFGPILSITAKYLLGQEPDQRDYKNVGLGINLLISKGIEEGKLKGGVAAAFAEGGSVDSETLSAVTKGGDITDWVASTFKKATETNAQKTLREIQENLKLKGSGGGPSSETEKPGEEGGDGISEGGIAPGLGVNKAVSVAKKLMVDLGVTSAQAAGIVGNFLYESAGMNPGEREGAPYGTPERPPALGTIGVGYGWAQWTNSAPGDRLDKFLKSYGGDKGKIATDDDNYRYLMSELKGGESIKGMPADDPQAASDWFRVNWERAGVPADKKRRKETMEVFNKIKGLSRQQAKIDVERAGGRIYSGENGGTVGGSGNFIQGNSGRSDGTHFHIGTNKPGDGSGVAAAGFNVIKHFLGKKSVYVGRSKETIPANAKDEQIRGYIARGQAAHRQTELDLQIGGIGAGNKVAFPLSLKGMKYSQTDGYGVSADIVGTNAFVGHGRYKPDGSLAPQQRTVLNSGAPDFYAFHGKSFGIVPKGGLRLNLHEGEMFKVVDKDSVDLLGFNLTKEIIDIENKAQLVARAPSIIEKLKTISGYASYEDQQTVVVIDDGPANVSYQGDSIGGVSGLSGYGIENAAQDPVNPMFESTYASR